MFRCQQADWTIEVDEADSYGRDMSPRFAMSSPTTEAESALRQKQKYKIALHLAGRRQPLSDYDA